MPGAATGMKTVQKLVCVIFFEDSTAGSKDRMQTIAPLWLWATFIGIVLASLFIDFVVLKKQGAHDIGVREAFNWSMVWIGLSFAFNALFWWAVRDATGSATLATEKSLEFLTGWRSITGFCICSGPS